MWFGVERYVKPQKRRVKGYHGSTPCGALEIGKDKGQINGLPFSSCRTVMCSLWSSGTPFLTYKYKSGE
jgi:hypothetical protein